MNANIGVLAWMTGLLALTAVDCSLASALGENSRSVTESSGSRAEDSAGVGPRGSRPEVWLCAGERIIELLRSDAEWSFVKQHLSGIKLYVDQINQAQPEQLQQLARLVKENGYQVAVELGCCLDFAPMDDTAGEWSARHELAKIEKLYAAGGKVDFLDLDGPVRRLMHPDHRRDGQSFQSMETAADEVVDSVRIFHAAHPEIRFWHLTNFPNWGYRGDVSYHARGPKRQDYGDYDEAHRLVYGKLKAAGDGLSGVTIDNPYDYLMGEHFSVKLPDPKAVNWLQRVRDYEDRCRAEGLDVNLIVNSERGGHQSDELFCRETLQMVETYVKAGGRPTRWFVQTWYAHPKQIVPETAPSSMTALVKAVIQAVRPGTAAESHRAVPAEPCMAAGQNTVRVAGIVLKWLRGDKNANYRRAEPLIRRAAAEGARIICTTECFLDGYAIADKSIPLEVYRALGEPIPDGQYFTRLSALAKELNVLLIAGMLESDGEARCNTAALIGADGQLIGKYHKQQLEHEAVRNTPGAESSVFETPFGKVGVMICADRRFPDVVREFCSRGADFLICPSGGMFGPKNNDHLLQSRSRENGKYIVFVHPAEFLVTAPDGSIVQNVLLGDRLVISPADIGTDTDSSGVFFFELPVRSFAKNASPTAVPIEH